jgi:hypothetical protein
MSDVLNVIRWFHYLLVSANGLVHRAARFVTKPLGYEKPLRVQRVLDRSTGYGFVQTDFVLTV